MMIVLYEWSIILLYQPLISLVSQIQLFDCIGEVTDERWEYYWRRTRTRDRTLSGK